MGILCDGVQMNRHNMSEDIGKIINLDASAPTQMKAKWPKSAKNSNVQLWLWQNPEQVADLGVSHSEIRYELI